MKTFVMIPTWNESENIGPLIERISNLGINNLEIVVVDDNSPDGTWNVVEEYSKKDSRVHLLHRKTDKGRGFAGKAGFKYALDRGADSVIEMDADFSHPPEVIPNLLDAVKDCDIVLASRFVKGGQDNNRSKFRSLLTVFSTWLLRNIIGTRVMDVNSGYRCFKRGALEPIIEGLESKNCNIVQEVLYKCHLNKCEIKEIPLVFVDRKAGKTTKTISDLIEVPTFALKMRIRHAFGKL